MAQKKKKTQAERAVADSRKKRSNNKSNKKSTEQPLTIPARAISSVIFLGLFIVLLIAAFRTDGLIVQLIKDLACGILGHAGFIIAIPVLLYLFIIHAFSGTRPVRMRSICLGIFLLLAGCIAHLSLDPQYLTGGVNVISELYSGGIEGSAGGVICGGIAMLVDLLCGRIVSYIVLIVASVLLLLAGMQITVPSIIRAIQNRPRPEWNEEPEEPKQEPAAVVVNHIANKRIEYLERRRTQPVKEDSKSGKDRASEIMSQIDADVEEPVAIASGITVHADNEPEIITDLFAKDPIPETMPEGKVASDFIDDSLDADDNIEQPKPAIAPEKQVTAQEAYESAVEIAEEIAQAEEIVKPEYRFPPLDLLRYPSGSTSDGTAEMRENSNRLNETLASFKIEAHIINVTRGPSVTRYEVELEKGVRLSKLTTAADDIALSLGASGVRIAAVPGKISVVGIEVPNRVVNTVSLREVIDSQEFDKAKSRSSFAVGKDIGGSCIVGNISKLPHMLIAGTTGSGKSVCMNSIIISLLYKATPDEVKLIMIDPKMVELVNYNGIPHLLIPVVTDPKKAAGSLQWAVTEMMRRYKAMSDAGVRDLESYNSIMEAQQEPNAKLAQVVVVIDELADLMLVAAKEVEESICRIAQMGRAAGIHLVIATQRPSADVITGLMKANIPSRIAFSVASAMESRIILDTPGAEKLVGKGDMLYAPIGCGKPKRVQGCFVSDAEVEAVASYVKENFTTDYDEKVIEEIEKKAQQSGNKQTPTASDPEPSSDEMAGDEMLPAAVDVILETGQASVSMLQRRLKLGYARAARIVDEMEERGIVGPFMGSKPRNILVTKEQWQMMKQGQTLQMDFDDLSGASGDADPDKE